MWNRVQEEKTFKMTRERVWLSDFPIHASTTPRLSDHYSLVCKCIYSMHTCVDVHIYKITFMFSQATILPLSYLPIHASLTPLVHIYLQHMWNWVQKEGISKMTHERVWSPLDTPIIHHSIHHLTTACMLSIYVHTCMSSQIQIYEYTCPWDLLRNK